MFERLLAAPPYSLRQAEKEALLLAGLNELARFHYDACPDYARIVDAAWGGPRVYRAIEDVPFLPVGLFKERELSFAPPFRRLSLREAAAIRATGADEVLA